jgi:hypothetical protein
MAVLRSIQKVPTYGPGSVQLGTLRINTSCPLKMPMSILGTSSFLAPCSVTVTNVGRNALAVMSMEAAGEVPNSSVSPPEDYQVQGDGLIGTLRPGQSMTLPSPKSGYIGWLFVAVSPRDVRRNLVLMEAAAVLGGAGTVALGYYLGRRRGR